MRPLTIVLRRARAGDRPAVVALVVRPPDPPAVQAIELLPGGSDGHADADDVRAARGRRRGRRSVRRQMSSRTRIVLSIAVLFAFATAVSTLALRQVLLARVDARIEAALAQEVRGAAAARRAGAHDRRADAVRPVPRARRAGRGRGVVHVRGRAAVPLQRGPGHERAADRRRARPRRRRRRRARRHRRRLPLRRRAGEPARGVRRGTFVVTADLEHERAEVAEAVRVAGGIGFGMVVLVSVLAFVAVGRILSPLRDARRDGALDRVHATTSRAGSTCAATTTSPSSATCSTRCSTGWSRRSRSSASSSPTRGTSCARRSRSSAATCELLDRDPETYRIVSDELDRMSRFVEDLLTLAKSERPDFLMLSELDLDLLTEELMAKATRLGAARVEAGGDRRRAAARRPPAADAGGHEPRAQRRPAHGRGRHDRARLVPRRRRGADLGRGQRAGRGEPTTASGSSSGSPATGRRGPGPGDRPHDRDRARRAGRARERAGEGARFTIVLPAS